MAETPEEQPSTGVLGRIGSWFSPWTGKGPKSPTGNSSPTSEESVRPQAGQQQWEGEKEESSNLNPLGLSRDILLCEEENATQSAHRRSSAYRRSSALSSTETAERRHQKEEEFVEGRKKRTGQGKGREERSNGTSVSGNLEKNASHLTHLSSFPKQGVVWDSDQAHTHPQAQAGKRIHVYLEETSVIHQGICAGQEVVCTEVTKSLQVLPKAKSPPDFHLSKISSSASAEKQRTSYSAPVGVPFKLSKDSQLEPEPDKEQTEPDSMVRKNAARRKHRKNSQGDGGTSPQEKIPPSTPPALEELTSPSNAVKSPQGKSPETPTGESSVNPSPKYNVSSQASPEGGESKSWCPDTFRQDSNSVVADTQACVFGWDADMEDDDSFYQVERKTETPESKRLSMKVSRSEVKLFTKNVHLKPRERPAQDKLDFKSTLKDTKNEEEDKPKTGTDARIHDQLKTNKDPKPAFGQVADRISLFEQPKVVGGHKQTFETSRSVDVSPVRKATDKLKADFMLSDQRSRSAEHYCTIRSSSASPVREKAVLIKEQARNFTEASVPQAKPALPQKPAMVGMSQKSTSSVAGGVSQSTKLDSQDKLDTKEHIQATAVSVMTVKPDGQDPTALGVNMSVHKEQPSDSKTTKTEASKTADHSTKPIRVESNVPVKGTGDSSALTIKIIPEVKGPSRTGARSKRRKSREPTSPLSPNSETKPASKPEVSDLKQDQVDGAEETVSPSKQLTEKLSLPSDKAQRITSEANQTEKEYKEKAQSADTKEKTLTKELKVLDKEENKTDSSFKKENTGKPVNRQEGLPVIKDEPDSAACNSGTKKPVILPKKREKTVGHSLIFTQERELASEESKEPSVSSPSPAVRLIEKTPSVEQKLPIEHPKLDKEPKSKGKVSLPNKKDTEQTLQPQNKDSEVTNRAENKGVGNLEKVVSEKPNQTEKEDKEKPQQLLSSDKNTTKGKVSDTGQGVSATEGSVGKEDERKNAIKKGETQPIKDKTKPEADQPKPVSHLLAKTTGSSDVPAQTQHVSQTGATHPEKAAICAITQTNEAVNGTEDNKRPLKGETATNVPPEAKTNSTEITGTKIKPVVISAEPQPISASVEKRENSLDDTHTHGANEVEFSSSKLITKAAPAAEEVTVKAANGAPVLTTAQAENVAKKKLSLKKPAPIPISKSVSSERVGQDDGQKSSTVKSVPSEVKTEDVIKAAPSRSQCEESKKPKGIGKIAQSPTDSSASKSTVNVTQKRSEETFSLSANELSPAANSDTSLHPLVPIKKELVSNKPSQVPKSAASPEANRPIPESIQPSSMKRLQLPLGLCKDDSAQQQDAPSSWLDVDFPKWKLKVSEPKLSSSGSESNLLDTTGELDDDDFVEKIKKLCAPFSLPPRKHSQLRPPQPPFALPAIREARFEKTFDPEEFQFGLRKKNQFALDTGPSLLAKLQSVETKSGLIPTRASLSDRSMLLGSLDTHSQLRDNSPVKDEEEVNEEKDDRIKVKSRLEGSCVLSSLTSSSYRGKKNGVQAECTSPGDMSPSEAPQLTPSPLSQPPLPSTTATTPNKDILSKQSPAPSDKGEAQTAEAVVSESGTPLPSFNDIKLPDYFEKYLPREPAKPVQSIIGQEQVKKEDTGKMTSSFQRGESDVYLKPGLLLPNAVPPCFPGIPPTTHPTLPELKQAPAQPQGTVSKSIRTVRGFHKRPGKMVLFEKAQFSGQSCEIYRDVADATSLKLSPLISVKVIRGCWILYEKPDYQGRSIALEEGGIELTNVWAESGLETEPHNSPPMLIGSIRLVVRDYSIPHIDLFTEPEGHGRVTPYHDDTIETGSFGIPLSTASIQVHSGVWLVFSDPGFQGMLSVLEAGVYPLPETWGFPSPFVGSLRPLKMGGFKVENPSDAKAAVYEKPCFEGPCLEINSEMFSLYEGEHDSATDGANSKELKSVGSLKIIGGLWVGYSQPGFEGQQYILEEGEYLDCSDWGGSQLLSLRPVLADFMSPHLKMFADRDFGRLGVNIDLTGPVINMDDTDYGIKTHSVDVIGGVWVVFEEPGFCGESYILEKGLYGSPEDWGSLQPRVASAMPVMLDDFENAAKFKVQLFSEPGFQGSVLILEDSVASLQGGFSVASCKVLAGSWMAFEGLDFTGRMYVLEVGSYPDLRAMGCVNASPSILSLQTVGFEFSLPSITLFERCGLRGKRVVLSDGSVNLQLACGCSRVQSMLVEGGMWVLYEGINYRGAQILLKPGDIPDWPKFSSWKKIGSLRPLIQKQVHFRLRNRQTGLMMSVTGTLDDVKLLRIQETEETDGFEQIWFYHNGHLHCKLLEDCCLSPSGSVTMAGSRVGLTPEPGIHLWSITPEGFIRYSPTTDLVLDVKGGVHYDKNQVILNTLDPNKPQQQWQVEII
uniref:Beta/gamma crystallin 'Greek key' domain-containing protein n=1 Tax=Monopterus albus TaxID=43700 RepID=A0A3Q3PY78_MONAL|nr:absent in melanoma 1 protein-like isoform X2 [Monopterus albus]